MKLSLPGSRLPARLRSPVAGSEKDAETAREVVGAIRDFEHVEVTPVVDQIAEYTAELRHEYYRRGECELSYADAIHLAMAATLAECHTLYSGDADFADVDEIETVVL